MKFSIFLLLVFVQAFTKGQHVFGVENTDERPPVTVAPGEANPTLIAFFIAMNCGGQIRFDKFVSANCKDASTICGVQADGERREFQIQFRTPARFTAVNNLQLHGIATAGGATARNVRNVTGSVDQSYTTYVLSAMMSFTKNAAGFPGSIQFGLVNGDNGSVLVCAKANITYTN